jgi:hypothetical protein
MNAGFGSWLFGMSLGGMLGMAGGIFIALAATTLVAALLYAISGFGFAVLAAPLFLLFLDPARAIQLMIIISTALAIAVVPGLLEADFARRSYGLGELNVEAYLPGAHQGLHLRPDLPRRELEYQAPLAEFWMVQPEIAFADLSDNAVLAEALLKFTFAALLKEREQDLAFFDQRIEKGLVANSGGIVRPLEHRYRLPVIDRLEFRADGILPHTTRVFETHGQ